MSKESRARMVRSAASLIRTRGMTATSFSEVIEASGAPRGSIYHHFPQGKDQLAEDAIKWTSDRVLAHQRECPATTPQGVLDWFIDMWRQTVVASGGAAGCVVAGVAVDTMPDAEALMGVVRATFQSWVDLLAEQLVATGVPSDRARAIATATLAGMEGALILCRSERSVRPLEAVASELKRLLPPSRPGSGTRRTPPARRSPASARNASRHSR
jgi:TetR/AcrR family transcriptional regulator, lmrAB and yxaGH operons repressor